MSYNAARVFNGCAQFLFRSFHYGKSFRDIAVMSEKMCIFVQSFGQTEPCCAVAAATASGKSAHNRA